jgi:hypothetical protein
MDDDTQQVQQGYEPVEYVKKGYQPTGQNPGQTVPPNVGSAAVKPNPQQPNSGGGEQK